MTTALALLLLLVQAGAPANCPTASNQVTDNDHQAHGRGLWIGGVAFSKDDIASAIVDSDRYTGVPTIAVRFTESGQTKFRTAERCRLNRPIEIWIDDELISRPFLVAFIEGPEAVIVGNFTPTTAADFASRISPAKP